MNDPRFDALPSDPSKHIERLARDLAWGVLNEKWTNVFYLQGTPTWDRLEFAESRNPDTLKSYLSEVWSNKPPNPANLVELAYLRMGQGVGNDTAEFTLTEKGLRLAQSAQPGPIFISYCRSESTAFAILLSDRLKAKKIVPFLDKQSDEEDQGNALKPGNVWRAELKTAIEKREHFVVLIAPSTLSSEAVCQEIEWALASSRKIIPIWHRGFDPKDKAHFPDTLSQSIRGIVTEIDAIIVPVENPQLYENAIGIFLGHFGFQP